jgi:hypothetical protein
MSESALNNKRVLAVDDEPDILETLKEQLDEFPGLLLDTATDYETGFDLLNAAVSLGFPTVMLTAHALSVEALKKSIQMGARAYIPKDKMGDLVPFLEDVLVLSYRPGWKRVFERLGGFFSTTFGKDWQKKEKAFWEEVSSGRDEQKPVILRK